MNTTVDDIIRDGMQMTNTSNIKSFVKRLGELDHNKKGETLKRIFKHHYAKGSYNVFDKIRNELRILEGSNTSPNVPPAPRGAWYNVVQRPNGNGSILIGNVVYTQKKNSGAWTVKGGRKNRKSRRKTRRNRTRKHA